MFEVHHTRYRSRQVFKRHHSLEAQKVKKTRFQHARLESSQAVMQPNLESAHGKKAQPIAIIMQQVEGNPRQGNMQFFLNICVYVPSCTVVSIAPSIGTGLT